MEKIMSNPGLQHLAEKVFLNLENEDLKICEQINQSCKQILQNPTFWLKKFRCLSKESKKDWVKIIQSVKNSDHEKIIVFYLRWVLKNAVETVDLPFSWFLKFRRVPYETRVSRTARLRYETQIDWIKLIESEKNIEEEKWISFFYLFYDDDLVFNTRTAPN